MVTSALSLFTQRGFTSVTVDDIAEHSGVSARTFFRHFADKEEVLFADDDRLLPALLAAITSEPAAGVTAEQDMQRALAALAAELEQQREQLVRRQRIVDSQVSLAGRELAKQARWQQLVMDVLVERGYAPEQADLLAAIGFAIFRRSLHSWLSEPSGPDLASWVHSSLSGVRAVLDARVSHPDGPSSGSSA